MVLQTNAGKVLEAARLLIATHLVVVTIYPVFVTTNQALAIAIDQAVVTTHQVL